MKKFNFLFALIAFTGIVIPVFGQQPTVRDCLTDTPTISVDITPTIQHVPFELPPRELPPPSGTDEAFDRMIFMLHGLGSNEYAWTRAQEAIQTGAAGFPARKAKVYSDTYPEYSLASAGVVVHNIISNYNDPAIDPLNNFIIGHSQGGLVARACDQYTRTIESDRHFNGIATFASAHQGAMILNNIGMFEDLLDEGLKAILQGEISQVVEANFFLDLFFDSEKIGDYVEEVGDFITDIVFPIVTMPANENIGDDYKVGAGPLQALNSAPSDVAKAAFYGIEDEPVAFRALSSFADDPNNYGPFQGNNDDHMVEVLNNNRDQFYGTYEWWDDMTDLAANSPLPAWLAWQEISVEYGYGPDLTYAEALEIKDAFYIGYEWWDQANDRFKFITGALSYVPGEPEIICECEDPSTGWTVEYDGPCAGNDNCTEYVVATSTLISKPSDGVVLAESAGNYPGAYYTMQLDGSNHSQLKNDSNTKVALLALLDGQMGGFFTTAIQE